MKAFLVAVFTLVAAAATIAAPPEVPKAIDGAPGEIVEIVLKIPADKEIGYSLVLPGGGKASFREMKGNAKDERVFWLVPKSAGTYTVVWWTKGEVESTRTVATIKTGDDEDVPDESVKPKPKPKPKPELDKDNPFPEAGLRVMLVYDEKKLTTLKPEQQGVIFSTDVRAYLVAKCPKGADGQPECRMWPKSTDATGASEKMQKAFQRAKDKMRDEPLWLIVSNGTAWQEDKPPPTTQGMLDLLKKYGG